MSRGPRVEGTIKETLPNGRYKVELEDGQSVLAYVPGTTRMNLIRIIPGDRVKLELSPFDTEKARIVVGDSSVDSAQE